MRHRARVLMHEAPLATCTIIASTVFAAASASLRKSSDMSRLQLLTVHPQGSFAGPIRVCVSSVALVSLLHRSVANSFRCCDATDSDSLLLPPVQCCLKGCLAVLLVRAFCFFLALKAKPYLGPFLTKKKIMIRDLFVVNRDKKSHDSRQKDHKSRHDFF